MPEAILRNGLIYFSSFIIFQIQMTASDTFGRDFDLTRFAYNVQPKRAPSTSIRQKNEETREINLPRLEESFSNL